MRSLAENLKKAKENKKGFTLVEIIVVLVIIGILASLMLGALNGYIGKGKDTDSKHKKHLSGSSDSSERAVCKRQYYRYPFR